MERGKRKWWYFAGLAGMILYILAVPRTIPEETVLKPLWINSLESNQPINIGNLPAQGNKSGTLLPFILGSRFGYFTEDGAFTLNQIRSAYVSMSGDRWTEYEAIPAAIQIMNPQSETVFEIKNPKGYPLLLGTAAFIVGNEQSFIMAVKNNGEELWNYDFSSPVTCVDAADGSLLAGTLNGEAILLNSSGTPVFTPFEPGGSKLSVILGCAISKDSSRLALISGIGEQRFLLLERAGDTFKVIYHEFLGTGFRRPVHICFINNDSKVAFEREGGLGIYTIGSRKSVKINLKGEISILDDYGEEEHLFVVTSLGSSEKRLIAIRYPSFIVNEALFKSENSFMARRGRKLFLGGDSAMAAFELESK